MDQAISRSRGKVAGVFTIYLALNGLINFLLYFIRVVPIGGVPVANLIRNLVMISALVVVVIQTMRNKSGVVLFVAVIVYAVAFQWFTVTGMIKGTIKPSVYTYIMLLSLVSWIVVTAFSAFKCDRLVRYTWYLPALIALAFALGYYASIFSAGMDFEDFVYSVFSVNDWFIRPVFVLYLGLWLKSLADEHLRRGSYRF